MTGEPVLLSEAQEGDFFSEGRVMRQPSRLAAIGLGMSGLVLTVLPGTATASEATNDTSAGPTQASAAEPSVAEEKAEATERAARYGPYTRGGRNYNPCGDDAAHCATVKKHTYRGSYRCRAWASGDLLRYKCRIKDKRVDGTGVYVAIKAFGTPFDDPEGWDMASGRVGPKGTVRWYRSAGVWQSNLGPPPNLDFWRFHLCRYQPGVPDYCSGRAEIVP
jgi:hypothetical protein